MTDEEAFFERVRQHVESGLAVDAAIRQAVDEGVRQLKRTGWWKQKQLFERHLSRCTQRWAKA